MSGKRSSPGRGKSKLFEKFDNWKIGIGLKPNYAWMAGEPEWYECHEHTDDEKGTKVCLHWYTDGALKCPRCRPFRQTKTIAYVPLYREIDTGPCFVFVHEGAADLLAGLKHRDYVLVGRVEKKSSIFVRAAADQEPFITTNPLRMRPCNLLPSLLMMWGYPQLDAWVLDKTVREVAGSATEVSVTDEPTAGSGAGVPLPVDRIAGYLDAEAFKAEERAESARRTAAFVRSTKASANGNGKPKDGG